MEPPESDEPIAEELENLCREILSYFIERHRAQDTLEGIAEWWLLERDIERVIERVRQALALLVERKLVVEKRGADGRAHFGIDPDQLESIRDALAKGSPR